MGLFSKIKKAVKKAAPVIMTGGLSKAVKPLAKAAKKSSLPMAMATGGLSVALKNKAISKAVDKVTYPVGKRVAAAAVAMRLPSIAANINIKQALTDPKKYAKNNVAAYAKDLQFAKSIYGNLKQGNLKGMVTQAIKDTKAAATAMKTGNMPAVAWTLDEPVLPTPIGPEMTYSQATGDAMPMYPMADSLMPNAQEYIAEQGQAGRSKMPMIVIGAVVGIVLLVVVLK